MMDSYNLAWKLIYSIHGLVPEEQSPSLLETYHSERHTVAQQLIENDKLFATMFSGKVATAHNTDGFTSKQFIDLLYTKNGFISGGGIEYAENVIVDVTPDNKNPVRGTDYLTGILQPGTRIANVKLRRYASGTPRDIQDGKQQSHARKTWLKPTNNCRLSINRAFPCPSSCFDRSSGAPGYFFPGTETYRKRSTP